MTAGEIFALLFATFIGAFLFYEGFYRLFALYRLKLKGQCTNGTVVSRVKGNADNTTVPRISFVDYNGNEVKGTAKNSVPTKGLSLRNRGDSVKIYYDTSDPNKFAIDSIPDKLVCIFMTLCGCIFLYAAISNLLYRFF